MKKTTQTLLQSIKLKNFFVLCFVFMASLSFGQSIEKGIGSLPDQPKSDVPKTPQNYTATKVMLGANASLEVKKEFVSKYGQDFYYVYSDPTGKVVTKEEVEYIIRAEEEKKSKLQITTNPKK